MAGVIVLSLIHTEEPVSLYFQLRLMGILGTCDAWLVSCAMHIIVIAATEVNAYYKLQAQCSLCSTATIIRMFS